MTVLAQQMIHLVRKHVLKSHRSTLELDLVVQVVEILKPGRVDIYPALATATEWSPATEARVPRRADRISRYQAIDDRRLGRTQTTLLPHSFVRLQQPIHIRGRHT